MVMELKGTGHRWSPEAIQIHDMKVGSLLTVLKDLRDVVFTTLQRYSEKDTQDVREQYIRVYSSFGFVLSLLPWCSVYWCYGLHLR